MLTDRLFRAAAACLQPAGTLTIVTDSAFYAELLLRCLSAHDYFEPGARGSSELPRGGRLVSTGARGIELIAAKPGVWCRHEATGASSYFDRLWQTGLSAHSATHDRFVLHLQTRKSSQVPKSSQVKS